MYIAETAWQKVSELEVETSHHQVWLAVLVSVSLEITEEFGSMNDLIKPPMTRLFSEKRRQKQRLFDSDLELGLLENESTFALIFDRYHNFQV